MADRSPAVADTESPELQIATDMARRAIPLSPILIVISAVAWGWHGAVSSAFALALVLANFLVAAALLSWAARISPTMIMAVTLGGFIGRMAVVLGAIYLVKDASWVSMPALVVTLLVSYLGLLFWETRHVSASLAYPGLKPARKGA
jgi:hypothetical protein